MQSPERLFDETALFLHRVVSDLPESKRQMLERLHGSDEVLRNRKVLVVDDDARNIFALTSLLENHGMEVTSATNGRQAIEILNGRDDLNVVLMDIMMPEMDGYETMREIRREARFRTLPILALTAKAMKGDREKCLEAGASDYIAKPVNTRPAAVAAARLAAPLRRHDDRLPLPPLRPACARSAAVPTRRRRRRAGSWSSTIRPATSRRSRRCSRTSGCRLVRAQSADEALLALLDQEFAAIILDIKMPGMGGLELAELIKQRRRTRHVPILFLTAHMIDERDVLRGLRHGRGRLPDQAHPLRHPAVEGRGVRRAVPEEPRAGRTPTRRCSARSPNAQRVEDALRRRQPRSRAARAGADGGAAARRPAEGRVPRVARARAAQSARARSDRRSKCCRSTARPDGGRRRARAPSSSGRSIT